MDRRITDSMDERAAFNAYIEASQRFDEVLQRMQADADGYLQKCTDEGGPTGGQKRHYEIRMQLIEELRGTFSEGEQYIGILKFWIDHLRTQLIDQVRQDAGTTWKSKYQVSEKSRRQLCDLLTALGWPPGERKHLTNPNYREHQREMSKIRARQHYNL